MFLDESETEDDFRKRLTEYIAKAKERHTRLTEYMVEGVESRAKTDTDRELAD